MAAVYDAGRSRTPEQRAAWRAALAPWLPPRCGCAHARVLDLGAGTGSWSPLLAAWFGVPVVAVEPSAGMRDAARTGALAGAAAGARGQVALAGGQSEAIPLRQGSVAAAWLSLVHHHFDDLERSARELCRVLCGHGRVLLRGVFPDAPELVDLTLLLRYFPAAGRVIATTPRLDRTAAVFARAGFSLEHAEGVADIAAASLRDAAARVRLRADTALQLLPDEAFEAGLRRLEADAAAEDPAHPPAPIFGRIPLVVFARAEAAEEAVAPP
jgi:SAM-dependent methyltransferase